MRSLRGTNSQAVLRTLNPIIRGWAAYYRGVVSEETFSTLDTYMWRPTYKWATYSHPNKSKRWVVNRHYGRFNRSRHDHWGSATAEAAPTCSSSPGRGSCETSSSPARRPQTTPP